MEKVNTQKGITLVALIITIIILLIIAGVTIIALKGEDGIIGKSKQAKMDYEKGQEKEKSIFAKFESMLAGEEEKETIGSIASYTEEGVPIPVGFKYIEGKKDTGVVVQNEADGSEFVWVPVTEKIMPYGLDDIWNDYREPDVITKIWDSNSNSWVDGADNNKEYLDIINSILGIEYNNSNDFLIALQNDFNAMAESVHKNQGFYVGRYETSLNGTRAQVVKGEKSATPSLSSANRWYGLYAYQKKYSTNSVQGSMIWGSQYDAMIKWMGNAAETTIGDKKNKTRITGSDPDDVIRNVYDLYGNSFEWTLEANRDYRVARGGGYDDRDFAPKSKGYAR